MRDEPDQPKEHDNVKKRQKNREKWKELRSNEMQEIHRAQCCVWWWETKESKKKSSTTHVHTTHILLFALFFHRSLSLSYAVLCWACEWFHVQTCISITTWLYVRIQAHGRGNGRATVIEERDRKHSIQMHLLMPRYIEWMRMWEHTNTITPKKITHTQALARSLALYRVRVVCACVYWLGTLRLIYNTTERTE